MTHLIDKAALVAEIENLRKHYIEREDFDIGWNKALAAILSLIATLEVKEVELDKPFKGISVNTSFDGDDNLDTITITTKYYKKKGG